MDNVIVLVIEYVLGLQVPLKPDFHNQQASQSGKACKPEPKLKIGQVAIQGLSLKLARTTGVDFTALHKALSQRALNINRKPVKVMFAQTAISPISVVVFWTFPSIYWQEGKVK